jgi:hypothetical protein
VRRGPEISSGIASITGLISRRDPCSSRRGVVNNRHVGERRDELDDRPRAERRPTGPKALTRQYGTVDLVAEREHDRAVAEQRVEACVAAHLFTTWAHSRAAMAFCNMVRAVGG